MHLLAAEPGQVSDGSEPVDPAQTPGEIVVLSAADTELAALAAARAALETVGEAPPTLRLASLGWLGHPFSVDRYLDRTASHARLVIARVLGGEAYWPYGIEQFAARLGAAGIPFVALPGDDKPDDGLARLSAATRTDWETLWGYLVEGGPENARNFLRLAAHLIGRAPRPEGPRPLLRAGLYWPGAGTAELARIRSEWHPGAPVAAIVFYRALLQGAGLEPIDRLVGALLAEGLNPLPAFVASLKDPVSAATLARLFADAPPAVVLNTTAFAVGSPDTAAAPAETRQPTPLDAPGAPVFQVVLSGSAEADWAAGTRGLGPRDIAMHVALPEIDGRILTRAVSFKGEAYRDAATECPITAYRAVGDRVRFTARLAANWARLAATPAADRRLAMVLANYPNRDGRLANGVGLDTPASAIGMLRALAAHGYAVEHAPGDGAELMARLQAGPTNWLATRPDGRRRPQDRIGGERLPLPDYRRHWDALPDAVKTAVDARWGPPEADPYLEDGAFTLAILRFGAVALGIQPARGYDIDPAETFHSPDLVPPHHYFAFYIWLREVFGSHAVIHLGKHGNLEWLPGKALALSEACLPEAVLGALPQLYPFIVNDPGEGAQAKRRTSAVILDHLTPPLTRAETYGPLAALEALVDEYAEASAVDPRRAAHLRSQILAETAATGLDIDAGLTGETDPDSRLSRLDAWLCEIKESQIRDGLHVFGESPTGRQERDLAQALARLPRGDGRGADASLLRALAEDCGIGPEIMDPLDCPLAAPHAGPRHPALAGAADGPWRSMGDTVERLEALASALLEGSRPAPGPLSAAVLAGLESRIRPALAACGPRETRALLDGLDGRFVAPGPSGAPTRGRLDVLPTGRNFYSVDTRAVPTPAAWTLGWASATRLVERHLQEEGDWPRRIALTAWGTANMRTGGDDIAQALALMGVRPRWDGASRRVTGFEILPLSVLARPRVDVTLRVSGFFRDAFPGLIDLVDSAARAVMALDEPAAENPAAGAHAEERARLAARGHPAPDRAAGFRVFGSKPGAYGAGLQAMIDERLWRSPADLAEAWLTWGAYAYGDGAEGAPARDRLETRLASADAVVQNQDNREHDLLDSDDYYQFEGGMAATVQHLSGRAPPVYHADHSRPERPVIRTLEEEIARVVRARVVNPKWIAGVKRHGYKGAFEMAATVDYLFAFAATTGAVRGHHFDLVHDAYLADAETRGFLEETNPAALREIAARLEEAIERGLWQPRANAARNLLADLREGADA
ncbi:MAG: cobaltochelatase subunit CobN [Paracoccaceae bacterium]